MAQIIIFIVVSAAAIVIEFVWLRKRVKKTIPKTLKMEEEYIGKSFTAEEDIEDRGRMKVGGIYWTVENAGEKINRGEKAQVIGIKGN
jgi:membrane protein implicated in regulation of membrane protease activity